jgi:hypothetical protein
LQQSSSGDVSANPPQLALPPKKPPPSVAFPPNLGDFREEVQMKARQPAGPDAASSQSRRVPLLPRTRYLMMPHIRRVADEQGRAACRRQLDGANIIGGDPHSICKSGYPEIRLQQQKQFRVGLDRNDFSRGKRFELRR